MYTLYYADHSAAMTPRVILEEIRASYELAYIDLSSGSPRPADFLALNPNGWVPVLSWPDARGNTQWMYEGAAIAVYLCDRYPEFSLAPALGDAGRERYLQWLFYCSASVQNAFQMSYYPERFCLSEDGIADVRTLSVSRLEKVWQVVDDGLESQPWVAGDRFSAADVYLFMLTTWLSESHGHPDVHRFKNVARIAKKVMQRESVQKVYQSWIQDNA